jgi:hypothetical protein
MHADIENAQLMRIGAHPTQASVCPMPLLYQTGEAIGSEMSDWDPAHCAHVRRADVLIQHVLGDDARDLPTRLHA